MVYRFEPHGVCSREMDVEMDEQNVVQRLTVVGGCSGNLQGISALVEGLPATEVIEKLRGIQCGGKPTSCPDQLARGLERILIRRE